MCAESWSVLLALLHENFTYLSLKNTEDICFRRLFTGKLCTETWKVAFHNEMLNVGGLRARALSWPRLQFCQKRALSVNETAIALRPFYFAVHPDLFGQHPRERAVNEDSLKRLNEYIDRLHSNQRVIPASLRFFVRPSVDNNTDKQPGTFREVSISLLSYNVKETVESVLRSCDIPLEYVQSVESQRGVTTSRPSDRPIMWDKSFYDFYGIKNPHAEKAKRRPEETLSSWLSRNVSKAKSKQAAVKPVKDQIDKMVEQMKEEMGLKTIRWNSRWGLPQFRSCLLNLRRLNEQNIADIDTRGKSLVFGNYTGISLYGDIMLRCDDVPNNWLKFLKKYKQHEHVLSTLPVAEQELSRLLNNAKIIRGSHHRTVLAKHYLKELWRLAVSLRHYLSQEGSEQLKSDLSDVHVVVECAQGPIMLNAEGRVQIPSFTPGFLVLDFLNQHAELIRNPQQQRVFGKKCSIVEEVEQEYGLLSLSKDANVGKAQMEACCQHMLRDPRNIGVDIEGCRVRVAMFYSVMNDGQICIPWNWRGAHDQED